MFQDKFVVFRETKTPVLKQLAMISCYMQSSFLACSSYYSCYLQSSSVNIANNSLSLATGFKTGS